MLKKLDKKMLIYIGIGGGIILLLIIFLVVLKLMVGSGIGSKTFEDRLKTAAIEYYEQFPDKLPKSNGSTVSITIEDLVESGNLKDPEKLLKKGLTCTGKVNVSNNNDFYLYQPIIECSDKYTTDLLYKKILKDNPIVTSGTGLYQVSDYYLFRGEQPNNYARFAEKNWYILRINNDNTVKMIMINDFNQKVPWDDRYNSTTNKNSGKNDFNVSRIKEYLNLYYNSIFDEKTKLLIVPKEVCIGKVSTSFKSLDDSVYCSTKSEKLPVGLMQANEFPIVSLDPECNSLYLTQCTNYNYLTNLSEFWTSTAISDNGYEVLAILSTPYTEEASVKMQGRIVVNVSADAIYNGGTGTEEDPYIIK